MKNNVVFLVFLGFFVRTVSPPPVIPSEIVIDAAERLSHSGYLAMALTLQVVSQTLTSKSQASSFTLFAPSDDVFRGVSVHRPPPLQLLQYHFATEKYHPQKLFSLSYGAKIKTLYKNHYLCVTSSQHQVQSISINNITINPNPIYDFGPIVVYGVRGFFDLNFVLPYGSTTSLQKSTLYPRSDIHQYAEYIDRAAHILDSKYSVINDWMDLRVNSITVFALGNFTSTLISMHMVPCRLKWADIESLNDGDEIPTFVKGFSIKVSKSGRGVLLNGVGVVRPEVYHGERVIIHRIEKLLPFNLQKEEKHSAGLYCDRRTSIFLMVQPLMGISLYAMSKALLVPRCSELLLASSLVSFELVSFIIEFQVKAVEVKLLTIPLAIALVYITFAIYRHHPKSLKYMMFDLGFLLLTTELLVYIRITELVLSLPEWIELWAPYFFSPSLCMHFWEMMLLVFERMDKGDPISYILFVFLAAEIILMLVLVPLTLLRVLY